MSPAAAILATGLATNCGTDRHVVQGQRYDTAGNCLEPTSSIDIVEGSDPGLGCMATCLVTPTGVVYVTTDCGNAFPPLDDVSGTAAACTAALAAFTQNPPALCGATGDDGGGDAAASDGAAPGAAPPDAPSAEGGELDAAPADGGDAPSE